MLEQDVTDSVHQLSSYGDQLAVVVNSRLSIYFCYLKPFFFFKAVSITERFMQEFMYDRPVGGKR